MADPNQNTNVTFSNGSKPNTTEIGDDNNDSLLDQMGNIIEGLYGAAKDNFEDLLKCPGGQRRGWKILTGNSPVEFAPCGCYDDALWPMALGIPAAAKLGASMAAKALAKKAKKKWGKKAIKRFGETLTKLENSYYDGLKLLFNEGTLRRKLPPVKSGYKRLYMGQGEQPWQRAARDNIRLDNSPPVKRDPLQFNTIDEVGQNSHFWTDDIKFANPDKPSLGPTTPSSEIFYIDIPIDDANKMHLGNKYGQEYNLGLIGGQKYAGQVGAKYNPNIGTYVFPSDVKMPVRRRNEQGWVEIVEDTPNAEDIDLNPGIFQWNKDVADKRYYLDSSISGTNYLGEAAENANLAVESSTQAFFDIKDKTLKVLEKKEELSALLDGDGTPDPAAVAKLVSSLEASAQDLSRSIDKTFDTYSIDDAHHLTSAANALRAMSSYTQSAASYLATFLPWFLGLLAFIDQVMSLISIVKDKSCIPLMEGGFSEFSDKAKLSDIRNQRIQAKASVWAELNPVTCECTECPGGWQFCDHSSITNLYLKETNSCIPPCCGEQEFKPITLISTCKCDCPEGKVWMPCKTSDCTQSDSLLTSIFNPSSPGKCVDPNPNPEKLEWDEETCEWKCKKENETPPPDRHSIWIHPSKTQIKLCAFNKPRLPPLCDCSGAYTTTGINPSLNIVTLNSIKLI